MKKETRPKNAPKVSPILNAADPDLAGNARRAWSELSKRNNPPRLFSYGGIPQRIQDYDGRAILVPLTADRLRFELGSVTTWARRTREGVVPAKPPMDVVKAMLASPECPLPILERIVEVPVFGFDGTLRATPGYHAASRTYFAPPPNFEFRRVPAIPSREDVESARQIFEELLHDFPFVEEADKAHAIALAILPYARALIQGPTPNHAVESPTPGTGKGLLVSAALRPSLGSHLTVMPQASTEDEWRKRLMACLMAGNQAVIIDNVNQRLDSASLAAALTAYPSWIDRVLGKSEMALCPVQCVWATTANNPTMSTEIARRSIRIRLDAKAERPWTREEFRHPDLFQWVQENRADLVWAAHVLVTHWVARGKPSFTGRSLGSFERWSAVIGGILETAGIEGFLGNLDQFYETVDEETDQWSGLIELWWTRFKDQDIAPAAIFDLAKECGIELSGNTQQAQRVWLGSQLSRLRDRIISGYRIVAGAKRQRAIRWRLEPSHPSSIGESSECSESHNAAPDIDTNLCLDFIFGEKDSLRLTDSLQE